MKLSLKCCTWIVSVFCTLCLILGCDLTTTSQSSTLLITFVNSGADVAIAGQTDPPMGPLLLSTKVTTAGDVDALSPGIHSLLFYVAPIAQWHYGKTDFVGIEGPNQFAVMSFKGTAPKLNLDVRLLWKQEDGIWVCKESGTNAGSNGAADAMSLEIARKLHSAILYLEKQQAE